MTTQGNRRHTTVDEELERRGLLRRSDAARLLDVPEDVLTKHCKSVSWLAESFQKSEHAWVVGIRRDGLDRLLKQMGRPSVAQQLGEV